MPASRLRQGVVQMCQILVCTIRVGVILPASREASHDGDGATGQADDVVSDGADQMADQTSCVQPFQSRQVGPAQEQAVYHAFSATPLGVPGEVFQVLGIGLHDVEMG